MELRQLFALARPCFYRCTPYKQDFSCLQTKSDSLLWSDYTLCTCACLPCLNLQPPLSLAQQAKQRRCPLQLKCIKQSSQPTRAQLVQCATKSSSQTKCAYLSEICALSATVTVSTREHILLGDMQQMSTSGSASSSEGVSYLL